MKKLKKTLKFISIGFLTLLLILFGSVSWLIYHPHQAFEIAQKYFLPDDLKITWQNWDLKAKKLKGWDFLVDWEVDDLLLIKTEPHLNMPLRKIHLKARIAPFDRKLAIETLVINAPSRMEFQSKDEKETDQESEPEKNVFQKLQQITGLLTTIHNRVSYQNIDINISELVILSESAEPLSAFTVIHSNGPSSVLQFKFGLTRSGVHSISSGVAGQFDPALMETDQDFLDAKIHFQGFNIDLKQNLQAQYHLDQAILDSKGTLQYSADKFKVSSNPMLRLQMDSKRARLDLTADVKGIPGFIPKLDNLKIQINTPLEEDSLWGEQASDFRIVAPVELSFVSRAIKEKLQKSCHCRFPLSLVGTVTGKAWLAQILDDSPERKKILEAEISFESVRNKLFTVDLASTLKVEKENSKWKFSPVLNCKASITHFREMKPLFEMYKVLIPAPLDVLDGTIKFWAQGPVSSDERGSRFPARLDIDLSSETQRVQLKNEATLTLSPDYKKMNVQNLVHIDQLQIELPPLNPIGGKPRVTVDKRILKTPPVKKKKSNFQINFDIQVETSSPGAIKLLSEYFKPYLPLSLDLQLNSKKENDGSIQLEPFDIVYLRRKVHVEKMRLELGQIDEGIIPVDGRFRVEQTYYTVYIDVKGNAKHPNIIMTSDPELPQSEIISVLLYDRTSDNLAAADAETSGGVQAAVADRAIGLFGLWAFASTPIRSFSYNPVTKVYTATISLGGDVTAGIGTTWESTAQLELRKRVSKRWMLTARWTAATPAEDQNTEIVLQWERRF